MDTDCFADHNLHIHPHYWHPDDSAFHHDWSTGILWIKPPWSLLSAVAQKMFNKPCTGILICPVWLEPWYLQLLCHCMDFILLPPFRLYRRHTWSPPLPPPKWRTCAMRWDSFHSSGWKRDLVADGDVESNPGPVPDFSSFLQHDLDEFSQAVPPMDLTRQPPHRIRYIPWNPSKILPRNTTPFSKNFPTNPCGCVISRPCF